MTQVDATVTRRAFSAAPLILVTCDSHVGPSSEQLRGYCPSKHLEVFDQEAEQVRRTVPQLDDERFAEMADTMPNLRTTGHNDVHARLRDMNYDGVAAEVIFHGTGNAGPIPFQGPPIIGFGDGSLVFADDHEAELAAVGKHIYNQWLADFVSVEPERHVGLAHLPIWDIDAAIAELEWAVEAGLRGVNFPSPRPSLPPYNDHVWEPFWSACEALEAPLTTHAQGVNDPSIMGPELASIGMLEIGGWPSRRAMHMMVLGGVFERHPKLKLVFTEQPGDWWDHSVRDIDSAYLGWIDFYGDKQLPKLPSEYCASNVFIGASMLARFEAELAVENGYVGNVIWGTDYPHPEGTWAYTDDLSQEPVTRQHLRFTFGNTEIAESDLRAMLGENGIRVYGFDTARLAAVANRINPPTLDQITQPLDAVPANAGRLAFRKFGHSH